jgi:hypothetical protein
LDVKELEMYKLAQSEVKNALKEQYFVPLSNIDIERLKG